jgi:hypothetical protein
MQHPQSWQAIPGDNQICGENPLKNQHRPKLV